MFPNCHTFLKLFFWKKCDNFRSWTVYDIRFSVQFFGENIRKLTLKITSDSTFIVREEYILYIYIFSRSIKVLSNVIFRVNFLVFSPKNWADTRISYVNMSIITPIILVFTYDIRVSAQFFGENTRKLTLLSTSKLYYFWANYYWPFWVIKKIKKHIIYLL